MTHILIIGGGFGGLGVAKQLRKLDKQLEITIVDKDGEFVFIPMLPDIALGFLKKEKWSASLADIAHKNNIKLVIDTITNIDLDKNVAHGHQSYDYDYVVLATGATDNFFNTPGAQHCMTLKSAAHAQSTFEHIKQKLAEFKQNQNSEVLSFGIIGAGPTGVELATAIEYYLSKNSVAKDQRTITLINSASEILPVMAAPVKKKAMKYLEKHNITVIPQAKATEIAPGKITYEKDGQQELFAQTIFWTAGVKPYVPEVAQDILGKGHFMCSKTLQVDGYENAFAIGDCAAVPDDKLKFVPKVAQAAMKQAKYVAANIVAHLRNGEQKEFVYKPEGYMMSLGDSSGIVDLNGPTISGPLAAFFRKKAYGFRMWELK